MGVGKYWNRFSDQKSIDNAAVCERCREIRKNYTKQSNACNRFIEAIKNVFIEFGIDGIVLGITDSLCLIQGWISRIFWLRKTDDVGPLVLEYNI